MTLVNCPAHLKVGDDFGDNECTFKCSLKKGHRGLHKESYKRGKGLVVVRWDGDDRDLLDRPEGGVLYYNWQAPLDILYSLIDLLSVEEHEAMWDRLEDFKGEVEVGRTSTEKFNFLVLDLKRAIEKQFEGIYTITPSKRDDREIWLLPVKK